MNKHIVCIRATFFSCALTDLVICIAPLCIRRKREFYCFESRLSILAGYTLNASISPTRVRRVSLCWRKLQICEIYAPLRTFLSCIAAQHSENRMHCKRTYISAQAGWVMSCWVKNCILRSNCGEASFGELRFSLQLSNSSVCGAAYLVCEELLHRKNQWFNSTKLRLC